MTSYPISIAEGETHFFQAFEQFTSMVGRLSNPASQQFTHGAVETVIYTEGMELLRRMMQGYMNKRSEEEMVTDQVMGADGMTRTHRRHGCERRLETRFGEVIVKRWGYGCRQLDSIFPLDSALNLPPDKYSHGLRIELAHEVIHHSFDEAVRHFKRMEGGRMAKRQAEQVAVDLSQDFDAYYRQPLEPQVTTGAGGSMLVITADGKGIVMHPDGLREATRKAAERAAGQQRRRLGPGEKGHRKRMATVVSVYEIAPYHRTPGQVLHPEEHVDYPRPKPCRKRTWARVEDDLAAVIEQGFLEAIRRDPGQQLRWVILTDGQDELVRQVRAMAARYKVEVTMVQDFIHVIEYLWKAAHALYPDHAAERETWVGDRAHALLEGRATDVAAGLRRSATRKQLNQQVRQPVDKAADYIAKSQERLRYDVALAQGLPIATGVIEGACRHLVKDRMDITGARWGLQRAEAILKLRSLKICGDLEEYLAFHFREEQKRHYPEAPLPMVLPKAA